MVPPGSRDKLGFSTFGSRVDVPRSSPTLCFHRRNPTFG
jgi:hypothetical protein